MWTPRYGFVQEYREDVHGVFIRVAAWPITALDEAEPPREIVEIQLAPDDDTDVVRAGSWIRLMEGAQYGAIMLWSNSGMVIDFDAERLRCEPVSEREAAQLEDRFLGTLYL